MKKHELELDYLAPFLAQIGDPPHISRQEAYKLKEECLQDLKHRLIDKANLIQARFEKVSTVKAKLWVSFKILKVLKFRLKLKALLLVRLTFIFFFATLTGVPFWEILIWPSLEFLCKLYLCTF